MNKTGIEYLTHTWNPIAMRCTKVSPACDHCWHLAMCKRMANNPNLSEERRAAYAGGAPTLLKHELVAPTQLRRQKAVIGVQFMGDLFHEDVPFEWIEQVWNVMYNSAYRFQKQHTFVVLTKRPERAREFFAQLEPSVFGGRNKYVQKPLLNVIGMVTVENQEQLDRRVPILLDLPFQRRGISAEPLLGAIAVSPFLGYCLDCDDYISEHREYGDLYHDDNRLDWVIVGGETGPGARPMHPESVRQVRDQCVEAGVPFFFKHWGTGDPGPGARANANVAGWDEYERGNGHLLDGQEWHQMPEGVR